MTDPKPTQLAEHQTPYADQAPREPAALAHVTHARCTAAQLGDGSVQPQKTWPINRLLSRWVKFTPSAYTKPDGEHYRDAKVAPTPGAIMPPAFQKQLRELQFSYAGTLRESVTLMSRSTGEVWLDLTHTITLRTIKTRFAERWFFTTYFDDGTAIITWSHPNRTRSSARLISQQISGSLATQFAWHQNAVRARVEAGARPVPCDNTDDAAALGRHFYRAVLSPDHALAAVTVRPLLLLYLLSLLLVPRSEGLLSFAFMLGYVVALVAIMVVARRWRRQSDAAPTTDPATSPAE
ncbi:MAG: hypothetical protein Q8Q09_01710 [Deltaproteobacteria bacterium]|nr:hypothetical protein [Deltaproteobacteria bacterium]